MRLACPRLAPLQPALHLARCGANECLSHPYVGPILWSSHKARTDGVRQDVIRFFTVTLFLAKPVFEKVPLPHNTESASGPPLPSADDLPHGEWTRRKRNCRVEMIRHEKEQMDEPKALPDTMRDGLNEAICSIRMTKLVVAPGRTIHRQKIDGFRGIDPKRDLVR